jgi:hypothetical protein
MSSSSWLSCGYLRDAVLQVAALLVDLSVPVLDRVDHPLLEPVLDHALLRLHLADLVDRVGPDAVDALAHDADLGLQTPVEVLWQLGFLRLDFFEHVREVVQADLPHVVEHLDRHEVAVVDLGNLILVYLDVRQLDVVVVVDGEVVPQREVD